jgi:hypothetical protein
MAYSKNYKLINDFSRTVLVKGADQYGGQILSVKVPNITEQTYELGLVDYTDPEVNLTALVTSSNGNGEGGSLTLTFRARDFDGTFYSGWQFSAASGAFRLDGGRTEENGAYFYNIGEELTIDMAQFSAENTGLVINAIVTAIYPDRNYGYFNNHQILYDRFDKKVFFRVTNLDGTTEDIDFSGTPYIPSSLPDDTFFVEFERVSSNELLFTYNNAPLTVRFVGEARELITISSTEIFQNSIRVITATDIEYGVDYQFDITFTDVLGADIQDAVNVNIADPGGTGDDWAPVYNVWTGTPYFIDEAYHIVIYTANELLALGLIANSTISRIGLPLHLEPGQGGNVTNEDVESGFVVAASVHNFGGTTINNAYVQSEYIVENDDFDPQFLDINVSQRQGVVETINGQRWVFFQVENYIWNGTSNIQVIYWMDGSNPLNGGFNGGYINTAVTEPEEVLGTTKQNSWTGTEGIPGEKAAIAFTTLR